VRKRLSFTTYANTSIEMDVPEEVAAQGDEAIALYMQENGNFPTLCHQCSGYGREAELELGDEWKPVRNQDGTIASMDG